MSNDRHQCAWCDSHLQSPAGEHHHGGLCTECHDTFESESHISFHPHGERHPYHD